MKRLLALALLAPALAAAQDGALSGPTGLLTVPTADVLAEGSVRAGASHHDAIPENDGVDNYLFTIGLLPGFELGGRAADFGFAQTNDLSFHAKYAYRFDSGFALAVGGEDIGGEARNFRSRYAVATLPWRTLKFTAGHGWGPDVHDGVMGGIEWRPWPFVGVYAEYDTEEVNPGLRLQSGALWAGLRIGANVGHRGATDEVEGGVEVTIPLGRRPSPGALRAPTSPRERGEVTDTESPLPAQGEATANGSPLPAERGEGQGEGPPGDSPSPAPSARPLPTAWGEAKAAKNLRAALEALGFESVRTGQRGDVLVVSLENRRYNHAAADGLGLALGTIAMRASPDVARIELALSSYGVPQVVVATAPAAWREFLRDGVAAPDLLEVRYGAPEAPARWHNAAPYLDAAELVIEPVLRTFVATEFGMLDVGLGARARLTAPLGHGVVGHIGFQVPLALTDDFRDGENFAPTGPEGGLDQFMVQYAHKPAPSWTSLWSFGLTQVFQADLRMVGNEQLWVSPQGRHRLHAKAMLLDAAESHKVALGGYTWFDAARRWSATLTAGRFYANDTGARFDLSRYFGDTIAGVFWKVEAEDNMAVGFQLSVPLTPRRDAMPSGIQVKGARRWGHSLQTTVNLPDGTNTLKPLLLYEPVTDLDLRRDFLDSSRLSPEWLRGELPRMREAYLLWGTGG